MEVNREVVGYWMPDTGYWMLVIR